MNSKPRPGPSMANTPRKHLIENLSPREQQFFRWTQDPKGKFQNWLRFHDGVSLEAHMDLVVEKWGASAIPEYMAFADKCIFGDLRKADEPIPATQTVNRICQTNCMDTSHIMRLRGAAEMGNPMPIFLGEGDFKGNAAGYMLHLNLDGLFEDNTPSQFDKTWLDKAVLAMDISIPLTNPTPPSSSNPPSSTSPQKRPRNSHSSGTSSTTSVRSTDSDTFNHSKPPFTFLQIGSLKCCYGDDWKNARSYLSTSLEFRKAWKDIDTGFTVVARLDAQNYPRGPVYVIYRYKEIPSLDTLDLGKLSLDQPLEPRDIKPLYAHGFELPHIRRLNPDCQDRFFMAKIANSIRNLGDWKSFKFEVVLETRKNILPTKATGPPLSRVIPTHYNAPSSKAAKKSRG